MNKQLNTTLVFALAFVVFASIQMEAKPTSHTLLTVSMQQQKPANENSKGLCLSNASRCQVDPERQVPEMQNGSATSSRDNEVR
jgi:hypothetical protein